MNIFLDLAPLPSDFALQSPSEIFGDMILRASPAIIAVVIIVVAAALIITKIHKDKK